MKKTVILVILIILLLSTSASANTLKINDKNQLNSEDATIIGTVEEAVTCIPDPLPDATVKVTNLNPFIAQTYTTTTDSNGEFEIRVPPGSYKISAEKKGYRMTSPIIPYFEILDSGETYEYKFFMLPSKNKNFINEKENIFTIIHSFIILKLKSILISYYL